MIFVVAAGFVGFLVFLIFYEVARLRERRVRDIERARPKCKHGRDKLRGPKCEECYEETRAYFEEKEKKDHPLLILPPTTVGSTISFTPGEVTFTTGTFDTIGYCHATDFRLASSGCRIPQRGEWWTPIRCKRFPAPHAASIPVLIDWEPDAHEIQRAKCGCLVYGQHTI